jgi:hypothetical protein
MKISLSRSAVLTALVMAILLFTVPRAILRIVQTGDPYLFTRQFFEDMLARLSGPGRLRFILQPTVAVLLGMRDGVRDARTGSPPFLSALIYQRAHRHGLLRTAFVSLRDLVAIAILLDLISQYAIFRVIRPGAALLLGPVLITVPYGISRALANRIARGRTQETPAIRSD